MNGGGARLLAFAGFAVALGAGCKAGVALPPDLLVVDLGGGGGGDLGLAPPDFTLAVDASCPYSPKEICNDGCDNDGNGYLDLEDPACADIVVAGIAAGDPIRWTIAPSFTRPFLSLTPWSGAAAYRHDVTAGEAWVVYGGPAKLLERIRLSDGKVTYSNKTAYGLRDVCFFGGKPILIEANASGGRLHQLAADGTEQRSVAIDGGVPAACGSDGQQLYVPVHAGAGRSLFLVYDASLAVVATRAIPAGLVEDRCLDLAWTRGGFYGLFVASGGGSDITLNGSAVYPFAMDGGLGAAIALPDAGGPLHSLGEFAP